MINSAESFIPPIDGSGALAKIRGGYAHYSKRNKQIADYIMQNPEEVMEMSVTTLSERCGAGEATIIRFCQTLGFAGFQGLKLSLAKDLAVPQPGIDADISPTDDLSTMAQKICYRCSTMLQETLKVLDMNEVDRVTDFMISSTRLLFFGVGASGISALEAKYRFLRIGLNCDSPSDPHMANMSAATLGSEDLFLGFSQSGSTKDVVDCMRISKSTGATIAIVTSSFQSPMTKLADIVLCTAAPERPLASGNLLGKLAQSFIIDLLYIKIVNQLETKGLEIRAKTAEAVAGKLY